jgi:hypothetical protein
MHRSQSKATLTCLSSTSSMEIIPLAGNGCFWNAHFLIAFAILPLDSKIAFQFQ